MSGCSLLLELPADGSLSPDDDGIGAAGAFEPTSVGSNHGAGGSSPSANGGRPPRADAGGSEAFGGTAGAMPGAGGSELGGETSSGGSEATGGGESGPESGGRNALHSGGSESGSGGIGDTSSGGGQTGGTSGSGGSANGGRGGNSCAHPCDCDGDGYDAKSHPCGGDDCDDRDERVHPGQTQFFVSRSENELVGFDFNCSGTLERDPDQGLTALSCLDLALLECAGHQGFQGALPACGQTGQWSECRGFAALCSAFELDSAVIARCH